MKLSYGQNHRTKRVEFPATFDDTPGTGRVDRLSHSRCRFFIDGDNFHLCPQMGEPGQIGQIAKVGTTEKSGKDFWGNGGFLKARSLDELRSFLFAHMGDEDWPHN